MLFNPAVLEHHLALELVERLLRLALAVDLVGEDAVSVGDGPGYPKEDKPEPKLPDYAGAPPRIPPNQRLAMSRGGGAAAAAAGLIN